MICHSIGRWPISIIGLGLTDVSSLNRVPNPPANITAFMKTRSRIHRPFASGTGTPRRPGLPSRPIQSVSAQSGPDCGLHKAREGHPVRAGLRQLLGALDSVKHLIEHRLNFLPARRTADGFRILSLYPKFDHIVRRDVREILVSQLCPLPVANNHNQCPSSHPHARTSP